jgi:uncharacterized protein YheU (UPF0270 family)
MIIPYESVSDDALNGLIEEFVTRDGTDYGMTETSLDDKVRQVRTQLKSGTVLIVFNEATEQVDLITKEQFRQRVLANSENDDQDAYTE